MWWFMTVIPATQEAEAGRSWLEVSLGKVSKTLAQKQAGHGDSHM
jgi:hypothetical protein